MIHISPQTVLLIMAGAAFALVLVWLDELGLLRGKEDDDAK